MQRHFIFYVICQFGWVQSVQAVFKLEKEVAALGRDLAVNWHVNKCVSVGSREMYGRRMNHVNYFIFFITYFINFNFCWSENPKLTVELMSSGFHR